MALICWGVYSLPPRVTFSLVPILRLMDETVFSGLVMAWRFATWPTRRSPVLVKPTTDGVVRAPFGVGDDDGLAAFHNGDAAVGSTKVDTNDLAHNKGSSLKALCGFGV